MSRNALFSATRFVNRDSVRTLTMPVRSDSQRDGPVGRILPYRRIAVVHQLVAVVLESLAKDIELRPRFVTR